MNMNLIRIALAAAVVMMGAGLKAAFVGASQSAPQNAAGGSIEGVVFDLTTGNPISGAEVALTRVQGPASAPLVIPPPPTPAPRGGRGNFGGRGDPAGFRGNAQNIQDLIAVAQAIIQVQPRPVVPAEPPCNLPAQRGAPRGALPRLNVPCDPLHYFDPIPTFPGEPAEQIWSGQDGKFSFRNLKPGKYRLVAKHPGGAYTRVEYGQSGPVGRGLAFPLADGQARAGLKLEMAPTGAISGRVVNENGDPMVNAVVVGFDPRYRDGRRMLNIVQIVHTNSRGEYRLRSLPPGEYYVSARVQAPQFPEPDYTPEPGAAGLYQRASLAVISHRVLPGGEVVEETYGSVFHGNVVDPEKARPIDLRSGETLSAVDIAMKPIPARHIRGVTVDVDTAAVGAARASGPPRANVEIRAARLEGTYDFILLQGRSDSNGTFDLQGSTPGTYVIAFGGFSGGVRVDVGDSDLAGVKLVLAPTQGGNFSGRLNVEGRPPKPDDPDRASMRVRLTPVFAPALGGLNPSPSPLEA